MKTTQTAKEPATISAKKMDRRAPFFAPLFQAKLTINQPNDEYEKEADSVADTVMRMPDKTLQADAFFKPSAARLQRKCAACEEDEKEKKVHLKPDPSLIQRQPPDEYDKPETQPQQAPQPADTPLPILPNVPNFQLPPLEPVDYLGINRSFLNRGLSPYGYGDASHQEWSRQYHLYSTLGAGNVLDKTFIGGTLRFFGVTPPGGDWNAWLSNQTTPKAIDSALSHDNPNLNEQEERRGGLPAPTIFNLPGVNFKKDDGSINPAQAGEEREADIMADAVIQNRKGIQPSLSSSLQRKCAQSDEEEKLHRKEENDDAATLQSSTENYISNLSSGKPLDGEDKSFFEDRIGHDFSNVRIHNDSTAQASAKSVNALAYTHGNNIVFGAGQYQPETDSGKKLMAHELTHVVQQRSAAQLAAQRKESPQYYSYTTADYVQQVKDALSEVNPVAGVGNPAAAYNILNDIETPQLEEVLLQLGTDNLSILKDIQSPAHANSIRTVMFLQTAAMLQAPSGGIADADVWTLVSHLDLLDTQQETELTQFIQQNAELVKAFKSEQCKYNVAMNRPQLSYELADAPCADDKKTRVKLWLQLNLGYITNAENKFKIDRRAIAGAIAWEAIENIRSSWTFSSVGPGKVHIKTKPWSFTHSGTVANQVEDAGYLPEQSSENRDKLLSQPAHAIEYIAAIMEAGSDIAYNEGNFDISQNPAVLTWFYNSKDLPGWKALIKAKTRGSAFDTKQNNMSAWVDANLAYLEGAVGKPAFVSPFAKPASPAKTAPPTAPAIHRKCADCESEETVQRKKATSADNKTSSYMSSFDKKGSPLPADLKLFFEPKLRQNNIIQRSERCYTDGVCIQEDDGIQQSVLVPSKSLLYTPSKPALAQPKANTTANPKFDRDAGCNIEAPAIPTLPKQLPFTYDDKATLPDKETAPGLDDIPSGDPWWGDKDAEAFGKALADCYAARTAAAAKPVLAADKLIELQNDFSNVVQGSFGRSAEFGTWHNINGVLQSKLQHKQKELLAAENRKNQQLPKDNRLSPENVKQEVEKQMQSYRHDLVEDVRQQVALGTWGWMAERREKLDFDTLKMTHLNPTLPYPRLVEILTDSEIYSIAHGILVAKKKELTEADLTKIEEVAKKAKAKAGKQPTAELTDEEKKTAIEKAELNKVMNNWKTEFDTLLSKARADKDALDLVIPSADNWELDSETSSIKHAITNLLKTMAGKKTDKEKIKQVTDFIKKWQVNKKDSELQKMNTDIITSLAAETDEAEAVKKISEYIGKLTAHKDGVSESKEGNKINKNIAEVLQILETEFPQGFTAGNYPGHGGGSFRGRFHSVDMYPHQSTSRVQKPFGEIGFFDKQSAFDFALAIDRAVGKKGGSFQILYNDFTVAREVNKSIKNGIMVNVDNVELNTKDNYAQNLNWHGPLVTHFHVDFVV